jgi:hypothetical protein
MMFNFYMGNHDLRGSASLEDQCLAFQGALRELGHDTFVSISMAGPPVVNIVFENFVPPHLEPVERHLDDHIIGVICTERFEGSILNVAGLKAERMKNLMSVLRRCKFAWCLDPVSVRPLRAALPEQPRIYHVAVGYVPTLEEIEILPRSRKIWDVCFTGTMTDYRTQVVNSLTASGLRVIAGNFPNFVRRSLMARSCLQITLKHFETSYMPSQMRIAYCLANGFPIVSDFGGLPMESRIEEFCFNVERAQLADFCKMMLSNPAIEAKGLDRVAAFKSSYRMADLIRDTVTQSLA